LEQGQEIHSTEFWRFAQLAAKEELSYLVIGGLALNFHKILRNTIDSDVWIKPDKGNFQRLKSVLQKLGYEQTDLDFLDNLSETEPFIFGIDGPIEFLTIVHFAFDFEECFQRSKICTIESTPIPILGLLDLRDLKVRAGRPQDLRDVILIDEFIEKIG
jgi:hypothetical protein